MMKLLENLEKKSLYTFKINSDIKEQVILTYLNELNKLVKKETKKKELVIFVFETKHM